MRSLVCRVCKTYPVLKTSNISDRDFHPNWIDEAILYFKKNLKRSQHKNENKVLISWRFIQDPTTHCVFHYIFFEVLLRPPSELFLKPLLLKKSAVYPSKPIFCEKKIYRFPKKAAYTQVKFGYKYKQYFDDIFTIQNQFIRFGFDYAYSKLLHKRKILNSRKEVFILNGRGWGFRPARGPNIWGCKTFLAHGNRQIGGFWPFSFKKLLHFWVLNRAMAPNISESPQYIQIEGCNF